MKLLNRFVHFGIPVIGLILISSCGTTTKTPFIPKATNTVNTVYFKDLNLTGGEYEILNKVTATATIKVRYKSSNEIIVQAPDDDFTIVYKGGDGNWRIDKSVGVACFGYLVNDDALMSKTFFSVDDIVRRLAIYRLINEVQQQGADGIIEPTVSTNAVQSGKKVFTLTTRAEGRLVRLKTSK
ncbi:MAG: hypothetical protein HDS07_05605 [Bacteroides sp.]|nr:hypothetical protein [Bacteroides sp.]